MGQESHVVSIWCRWFYLENPSYYKCRTLFPLQALVYSEMRIRLVWLCGNYLRKLLVFQDCHFKLFWSLIEAGGFGVAGPYYLQRFFVNKIFRTKLFEEFKIVSWWSSKRSVGSYWQNSLLFSWLLLLLDIHQFPRWLVLHFCLLA